MKVVVKEKQALEIIPKIQKKKINSEEESRSEGYALYVYPK